MYTLTLWLIFLMVTASSECNYLDRVVIGKGQIKVMNVSSKEECCSKCSDNIKCLAFTLESDGQCFLKDNTLFVRNSTKAISGTVEHNPPPFGYACATKNASHLAFCDTSLNMTERINALVSLIKLSEIGAQLTARSSASINALGLPSYYWGTNAANILGQVHCLGSKCPTSFPQPCALGATFNMSLIKNVGAIIGRELRAYHNSKQHNGLDVWGPIINLNRDPRWGRNNQVPTESPYLMGQYATAFSLGLQFGPDDSVLQAVVGLKHWVAYSVERYNGTTRGSYDAKVSAYDLASTYFPPWEMAIKNAKPKGIMCSYNSLNGVPTCGNPELVKTLRDDWGFDGYITSDSDSCKLIHSGHHYAPDEIVAAADCLKGGTDINSGSTYTDNLEKAVTEKKVEFKYAQSALFRSYRARFEVGLFDPQKQNYYRNISEDVIGCAEHQAMSLLASRQSMILLKNKGGILPFAKGKKVSVIGLSANTTEDLLGYHKESVCPDGHYKCYPTIYQMIKKNNAGGHVSLITDPSKIKDATAAAKAADYVVLVASNSKDDGHESYDRTTINLNAAQYSLCKAVLAANQNTVLVLVNGGIIAIDDLKESSNAILETFFPGVHGAQAISETIFGDYNPGGKMPVTMYNSSYINEVKFLDMSMTNGAGRSFRYFTGQPLFPFGFGLSYTTFKLEWNLQPLPKVLVNADKIITYSVRVTNTGKIAGDEVVMALFKPDRDSLTTLPHDNPVIIKQLFGFKRINLQPGESVTLAFSINCAQLALVDTDGHSSLHPGLFNFIFTRGHGEELHTFIRIAVEKPIPIKTFRKWW